MLPGAAFAAPEKGSASLSGHVRDASGAAIVGAGVRLWQPGTAWEEAQRTSLDGGFSFAGLVEGSYRLSAGAEGFALRVVEVRLERGAARTVELTLDVKPLVEEIVVRAGLITGPPEHLQRIPGSLDVLDERTMENGRFFTFNEALRKVAGIHVREEEGFGLRPNIGVRGLLPTRSAKVLLLEDGIPLAFAPYGDNASYYHPPVDRYESIEVLKGSGQILFGPSTVGGVINYVTPAIPDQPSGWVTLQGGSRDYFNGHIRQGGTLGRTGYLLDFLRKQGEGARENVRSGLNDFNLKVVTTVSSRQVVTFRTNYYAERSRVTYSGLREDEYRAHPRQNPFRNDAFAGDRVGLSLTHLYVARPGLLFRTNLYGSWFGRDWWRQSSNSAQRPNDRSDPACGGMANLNTTCGNEGRLRRYTTWGIEPRAQAAFRLFGALNEADFGFRIHAERQERRQENGDRPTARSGVVVENNERRNSALSLFAQDRLVWGRWAVTPGLRVEHVRYQRTNRLAGATGETSLTQLIPGIGIAFTASERAAFFAGAHRGFVPPRTEDIISNATGGVVELDPELSWNFEAGFRSTLARGLRLESTFFRMDYENQVVPASVAGGLGAAFTNGGQTLHQGLELSLRADSGALLGSRHNFYTRVAYTWLPVAKFTGTRFSNVPGFSATRVSGRRLPYAPDHLLNLTLGYSHSRGLDLSFEAVHVADQFGDDLNSVAPSPDGQRGRLPGWLVWNATANYSLEHLRTTFFLSVRNLSDRLYIADRARGILPGAPRQVQAGVKYSF